MATLSLKLKNLEDLETDSYGNVRVAIFPSKNKRNENDPDYMVVVSSTKGREKQEEPDDIGF